MGITARWAIWGTAVGVLAADQLSKSLILALDPAARPGRGWITIRLVRNTGASFGIGSGHPLVITLVAMAAVAIVAVITYRVRDRVAVLCWAVVLGGAAGNLADRLVRPPGFGRGAVVDWIKTAGYPPSFNVADIAIRAGTVAAVIAMLATRAPAGKTEGGAQTVLPISSRPPP